MAKSLILTGISGSKVGVRQIIAGRSNVIGSASGCNLVFKDRLVHSRHAEIRQVLDRWFVVPLEATAQVFINGQTVRGQSRLNDGDTLTVGTVTFTVSLGDELAQAVGSAGKSKP